MRLKTVARELLSLDPAIERSLPKRQTGGTNSAAYCYEVWLKHLTLLREGGMREVPETLAELGPGDSLGVGLAAMLSGARRYYALDVVQFSNTEGNQRILDQLVALFRARAGRPSKGWPDYDAHLDERLFPSHILTERVLRASLAEDRIEAIRRALVTGRECDGLAIRYVVPWSDRRIIEPESVDVALSHSVLEHVSDLEGTYRSLVLWLKRGGRMSHQIDFTSHGMAREWNGHWTTSERVWKIASGRRPFLINRHPCSEHVDLMRKNGFKLLVHLKNHRADGLRRARLASRWAGMSEDDLTCAGTFIQAQRE
jgi:hypothetical protein